MEQQTSIKLCCGKGGCPEVSAISDKREITIKDDYGNTVIMKSEEAKLLGDAVSELLK